MNFIVAIVNGLSLGGTYAMIAIGYTMVYGIAKMLNFAHGSTQMTVPMKVIRELTVPIPDRAIQDRIVAILRPIYKKINENEKINNNLAA